MSELVMLDTINIPYKQEKFDFEQILVCLIPLADLNVEYVFSFVIYGKTYLFQ